jgi:RHS repeat-associated protein
MKPLHCWPGAVLWVALCVTTSAQPFRITETQLTPQGRVRIRHQANEASYYILLRGDTVTDIRAIRAMALGGRGQGELIDPETIAGSSTAFYRVVQVPLDFTRDSDADGIDDVFELRRAFLDPLDRADALADFDGDGRSNLEEYRSGTDPGLSDPAALTVIAQTSPAHGEGAVAVTRETVIRLSAPLSPAAVIGPAELFAEYGGRRLLSRVELSSDRRKVTLFYLEPLPDGARVRVTFDAASIVDVYGNFVDADGDGVAGGRAVIEFQTLSLALFPGTKVCGRVFASELAPAGDGQRSINVPLQGVTISVDGREETMRAVTDQNGDFRLDPAPAGRFFVHIDGRTATGTTPATKFPEGPYYPFVGKLWESVPGEETNIGEVYLPLVKAGTLQPVSALEPTVVTFPPSVLAEHRELDGLSLIVPPNALFSDDGRRGGMIGIAPVPPDRMPGPLPPGVNAAMVITVQTDGPGNFDAPVPVCFPNLPDPVTGEVSLPGAKGALMSFNHDTGRFEFAGAMTVSADGRLVCTDPGVGIPAPGWHVVVRTTVGGVERVLQIRCELYVKLLDYLKQRRMGSDQPPDQDLLDTFSQAELNQLAEEGNSLITVRPDAPDGCDHPPPPPRPQNSSTVAQEGKNGADEKCPEDGACTGGHGSPTGGGTPHGQAVFLHKGEEVFSRVDLVIPGRGDIQFVMRRTYRSQLDYNGPLGHGWNYDFNEALFFEPNGDVTRALGDSHIATWKRNPDGTYQAPRSFYSTLRRRSDGTFVLRQRDGFQHFYRADGRLFCYQDRFGNQMLFDYDDLGNLAVVVDPFGREIRFVFERFSDGKDRLTRIVDFIGREVVYTYDARFDLVAVRTPLVTGTSTGNDFPSGRTERYAYSSGFAQPQLNHNLLSVTYPEEVARGGPPALVWTYGENPNDPVTFDKVLTETEGGTNASGVAAGGTTTFVYEMLNPDVPPGNFDVPRGKVTVTERNGNRFEFYANERNHHILTRRPTRGLRPGEPAFYETLSFYDEDGQLVRRVFPEGNEIRYRYDRSGPLAARANLVEVRRVADPKRGGGEDLVTTFTYEPLYNQVASITDPRGNATGFTPPLGAASAARYITRFFYDYQESNHPVEQAVELGIDLSGVPRGLGDLNGDGRTDQTAGNLVRVEEPTVTLPPDSNEARRLGGTAQRIISQIHWNDRGQRTAAIDPEGNVDEFAYYPENDPDGDGQTTVGAYLALTAEPRGYLRASLIDSKTSPRRDPNAPPPAALETVFHYDPVGNLTGLRNPRGILTRIEVNSLNEPVVITRGADVSEALASGQLLQNEPPLGYRTRLFYDFNGRVVRREIENRDSTTRGVGAFVDRTYTYDILDNLLQSSVEIDATTTLTTQLRHDPNELLTLVTQPEGNQTRTDYDERNLRFRVTRGADSPDASTIQINYDLNANTKELVDAEDNDGDGRPEVTTFVYDGFDRLIETVDALGNRSVRGFDVASNLIRRRAFGHPPGQPGAPNVLLSDVRYRFDELNRVFQSDRALFVAQGFTPVRAVDLRDENSDGFVTTRLEYDALSRLTYAVEDDLEVVRRIYDGASRPIEVSDHLGNRRLMAYDRNSNPVRVQSLELSPEGLAPSETFTTRYVYDQLDRVVRITDNGGQSAYLAYDSRDNLTLRADGQGPLVVDPLGLVPGQINQPGNTTTWFYDGLNRRIRQVADLRVEGQGGNPLDLTNPHNLDGRISLGYEYDGNSRLIGIVDDNGNPTRFAYDALNRRIRQINADRKEFVTVYDRDDNARQVTDLNGTVTTFTYDALNRVVRTGVNRAPGVGGTTNVTYQYDGLSRLTRSTDDNGSPDTVQTCEVVYDSISRVLEDRQNGQPISTVWSGDGKRLRCVYPGGRTIDLTYDAIDRAKTVSDQAGLIGDCFWIGPGLRELRRNYANNTRLSFLDDASATDIGYDAVQRIARLRHLLPGGSVIADREYGYNRADMRTFERRHDDGGLTDRYAYDSTYRVVKTRLDQAGGAAASASSADFRHGAGQDVRVSSPPAPPSPRDVRSLEYVYDGAGNRREVQRTTGAGTTTEAHSINEMNEYTAIAGLARVHDDNGSLIDDGTRLLVYDYRNRLIEVRDKASGNLIARYLYLADNRRSRKTVFSQMQPGAAEKETAFLYDGWRVIEEQDGQTGRTETSYVYAQGYLDEPLQMQRTASHPLGAGTFFYHQNARHDVVALTDASGAVIEKVLYDDFGNPTFTQIGARQSAVGNPKLFHGRRLDPETGFYYFRNRYYDPQTGRFLQRDPVWDHQNMAGWYTFVGNGPVSRVDPWGLWEWLRPQTWPIFANNPVQEPPASASGIQKAIQGFGHELVGALQGTAGMAMEVSPYVLAGKFAYMFGSPFKDHFDWFTSSGCPPVSYSDFMERRAFERGMTYLNWAEDYLNIGASPVKFLEQLAVNAYTTYLMGDPESAGRTVADLLLAVLMAKGAKGAAEASAKPKAVAPKKVAAPRRVLRGCEAREWVRRKFGSRYEEAVKNRIKQLYEEGGITSEEAVRALENLETIADDLQAEGVEPSEIRPARDAPTAEEHVRNIIANAEWYALAYEALIGPILRD